MKIPSKLTIRGKQWAIAYKWRLHDAEKEPTDGFTDLEAAVIWLDRGASKEDKFKALLKEILLIIAHELSMFKTGGIRDEYSAETLFISTSLILNELFNMKFKEQK
jgi:hypothetical protein